MKKRLLSLLLALVILSSVVSVIPAHAEDDKIPTHTIMLYAIGTDLESDSGCFTFNLKQIARSAYNENVSFIVMTGGAKKWQTESEYLSGAEEISAEYNQIWRITGKENGEKHGKMTLLEGSGLPGLEKTAMSDPAVLTGFIDYCYENYKSDCYDIILWDHGGGPAHGYGYDARGGYLSLCDLYDAFSSCKLIKDGKRFEIIDFDACLMASAEVIAALGGFTDYFVGSAETEPGTGQEYYSWLTTLNLEPYTDGATLASYIVESTLLYYNYNTQFVEDATLSAVNTKNFFEKVLPGLIMTDDILISEARTKSEKNGKYNFYDEIYSLDGAIAYDYGDYSLYDLGNLLCALSVTQTEFDRLDDAEIESVSNAYTDTVSELIKTLSDDDVIFTKSTKSLKKAANIEYTRDMDGQIVWREADTIELKPTGLNVFFGASSISETLRYVKEAAELLKRLPESDAKEFIKKNAVSAAYYSIISSFGYYTSMLAEDDEEYVDFTTVRSFLDMIFFGDVYAPLFSVLVDAGEFADAGEAEAYLSDISSQQVKELIYPENITVKQVRQNGEKSGQYQINVSGASLQAMKNVYSSVTAVSSVTDNEDFKNIIEMIYGEPVEYDLSVMYPHGVFVNAVSAEGDIKITEYIDDLNDTNAAVKRRIYSKDTSVSLLDDADNEILVIRDAENNTHLCDVHYLDGAKMKAYVPILLYSDLFEEAFAAYLVISYKSDGWSVDGLAFSDEEVADRSYMPLENEMFYGYSYAPCVIADDMANFISTYVPLCGFIPADWEKESWGISFTEEKLSEIPEVKNSRKKYFVENVYGGITDITNLFEKADEAADEGDHVHAIYFADVEIDDVVYNGRQQKPDAKITVDGKVLEAGVDYKMLYDERTGPDLVSALAMGIGNYTGFVYGSYNILPFEYVHDPMENETVKADAVKDENAIYGFRPSSTGSLKMYADYDFSDPDIVEAARQERTAYHKSLGSMYAMLEEMKKENRSIEEIARALSAERNRIRLDAYKDDPEGLAALKQRNLEKYGHEEGPLPDELYEQYGSWQTVAAKAFSGNAAMDACLGLYDEYYDEYQAVCSLLDYEPETEGTETETEGTETETETAEPNPPTSDANIFICVIVIPASLICLCSFVFAKKKSFDN